MNKCLSALICILHYVRDTLDYKVGMVIQCPVTFPYTWHADVENATSFLDQAV